MDFTNLSGKKDEAQNVVEELSRYADDFNNHFIVDNGNRWDNRGNDYESFYARLVEICKNRCSDGTGGNDSDVIVGKSHETRSEIYREINDRVYQKFIAALAWHKRGDTERVKQIYKEALENLEGLRTKGAVVYAGSYPVNY